MSDTTPTTPTIAVTGATGGLGRLVVDELIGRGVPASSIVAVVRDPAKAADQAERGVQVRHGDYDDPASLAAAFAGVDRLLLISGNEVGQRVRQHGNAIEAAVAAGVGSVAYTSILKADTSTVSLAAEHLATEHALVESGIPSTFLRNGWYIENYAGSLPATLEHGTVLGATGGASFTPAARADFAAAAAAVLATDGHEGRAYELGGDAITLDDLAQAITDVSGTPVTHTDLPVEQFTAALTDAGLPPFVVDMLGSADLGIAKGDLSTDSGDLQRLVGRPLTPLADVLRADLPA